MLTQERADLITEILTSDKERAEKLLAMEPGEALAELNKSGKDFTIDELNEYCKIFKNTVNKENGELDEDSLEEVAGGVVITTGIVIALGACFFGGAAVGIAAGAKW